MEISNIEGYVSSSICYNDRWFLRGKAKAEFQHDVWIEVANICDDYVVREYISNNSL